MPRKRKPDYKEKFVSFLYEFGTYVATVLGVLLSKYLPKLQKTLELDIKSIVPSYAQLIGASIIALIITYIIEVQNKDKVDHIKVRLLQHFVYGLAVQHILASITNFI